MCEQVVISPDCYVTRPVRTVAPTHIISVKRHREIKFEIFNYIFNKTFYENQRRLFCAVITEQLKKGQPTNFHEKARINFLWLALLHQFEHAAY